MVPRVNWEERMFILSTDPTLNLSTTPMRSSSNPGSRTWRTTCKTYLVSSPPPSLSPSARRALTTLKVASEMAPKLFGLGRPRADAPLKVGPVQAEILQIIRDHSDLAHGVGIAGYLRDHRGHDVSDAQTYIALRRLDVRGLIAERNAETDIRNTPSDSRRGRPHKLYTLTASGKRALEQGGAANNLKAGTDAQMEGVFHGAKEKGPTPVVG